jgi:hypothetical protein
LGESDTPREEWPTVVVQIAELEDIGVLKKEVALFREKEPEAGQIDLSVVDFRCREVRVDRQRTGQAG